MSFALLALSIAIAPAATQTAPAPMASPTAPAARLNLNTAIATIVADPAGKKVLDTDLPGFTANPNFEMLKQMSLNDVARYAPDKMPPAVLAKTAADLAAIK